LKFSVRFILKFCKILSSFSRSSLFLTSAPVQSSKQHFKRLFGKRGAYLTVCSAV